MTDISLCLKGCNHQRGVNRMTTELEKLIAEQALAQAEAIAKGEGDEN